MSKDRTASGRSGFKPQTTKYEIQFNPGPLGTVSTREVEGFVEDGAGSGGVPFDRFVEALRELLDGNPVCDGDAFSVEVIIDE